MNQEEKLIQEILADAQAKAEKIIARARNEADAMMEQSRKDAVRKREARLADANARADKACKTIQLDIDIEINRRWLKRQEQCINDLLDEALSELKGLAGDARHNSLRALADEALRAIGNVDCLVSIHPDDAGFVTESWLQSLATSIYPGSALRYEIKVDEGISGGLVFETTDGRCEFDNTYSMRLERMREDLRIIAVKALLQ